MMQDSLYWITDIEECLESALNLKRLTALSALPGRQLLQKEEVKIAGYHCPGD
jgi:hypothetical protein